jgi:GNAT superfamily N-acetyltransferase
VSERDAAVALLLAQLADHAIDTPRAAVERAVDGLLADPRRGFLLVEPGVAVAWVSFTWALEHGGLTAWLEELYVVPDRRGSGIGTRLLREAERRARAAGCAAVDLEVDVEHGRAADLYRREGFVPLPRARWVKKLA